MTTDVSGVSSDGRWSLSIFLDPPIAYSFLSEKQRDNKVVLYDLDADVNEHGEIELSFNWIFSRVTIGQLKLRSAKMFHFATTGGELKLALNDAVLSKCTERQTISVNHSVTKRKRRNSDLTIAPVAKLEYAGAKVEFSGLKYLKARSEEVEYVTNLTTSEQILAVIKVNDGCTWDLLVPKLDAAIRHYVYGNLYLDACFSCETDNITGTLKTRPSGIRVFNQDGKLFGEEATFGMLFSLWRRGITSIASLCNEEKIHLVIHRKRAS